MIGSGDISPTTAMYILAVALLLASLIAKALGPGTPFALTTKGKARKKLRPVWDTLNSGIQRVPGKDGSQDTRRWYPYLISARWIRRKAHLRLVYRAARGRSVDELVQCQDAVRDAYRAVEANATLLGKGRVQFDIYMQPGYHGRFRYPDLIARSGELFARLKIPIGLRDDGTPVAINLGHILIVGATGSGKGSVLWSIIASLVRIFGSGPGGVRLFAIDPKHAEFAGAEKLFEDVAYTPKDSAELLDTVYAELKDRQSLGVRTFHGLGRSPVVLVIDELNSMLAGADRTTSLRIREQVNLILAQGRSAGVFIVAAGQQPQKDTLAGVARSQFQNRICMRVETADEVKLVLGESAVDKGVRIHELPPATETNGYATAGVGYVNTDEEPAPVRFRSPWISDEEIEDFCNNPQGGVSHD